MKDDKKKNEKRRKAKCDNPPQNEEDKEEQYLQYEKPTPSLAGSLRSWTTAVPSTTLTLSLLRARQTI